MNVIDVIYKKYPCIEKAVNDAGCIMATTIETCEYVLRSVLWKNYIQNTDSELCKKIWANYKNDFQKYGFISTKSMILLAKLEKIKYELSTKGKLNKKTMLNLLSIVKSLHFKIKGKPTSKSVIEKLIATIEDNISKEKYVNSAISILYSDPEVKVAFRDFMQLYLVNTCFMSEDEYTRNKNLEEAVLIGVSISNNDKTNPLNIRNINPEYLANLLDDNLAQAFPELYMTSDNEKGKYYDFIISDENLTWENRPEFPKYAQIFILRKSDYFITNFISAKRGFDTVKGEKDYDVYGQIICSSKFSRSSGMGKLLLLSTILMAYQYKVNYVFIQAMLGITSVQGPLYNRLGFNFYFPEELLQRKTAFYQWALVDEENLDKNFEEYKAGIYSPDLLSLKGGHLLALQPMWLNVRSYQTKYACDIITKSGFDYHSKKTGKMGTTLKGKLWDLPKRLLGYGGSDNLEETIEELPHEIPEESMRAQDGEECKEDAECLSDFCVNKICTPFPYNEEIGNPFLEALDNELRAAGFDVDQENNYYQKRIKAKEKLMIEEEKDAKEVEHIFQEQETLRKWYEIIKIKESTGEKIEEEQEEFAKKLKEYKKLTEGERKKMIAKKLLEAAWDSINQRIFGKTS